MFMPFQVLGMWLRAWLSLLLLGGGIALLIAWYNHRETPVVEWRNPNGEWVQVHDQRADLPAGAEQRTRWVPWEFGLNRATAFLLGGLALSLWSFGGGWLTYPRLLRRGGDRPESLRGEGLAIKRPDGTELRVEIFGAENSSPLVMIHGWSLNSEEWYYAKKELARHHRLIVWDLPGLGQSSKPDDRDWSLEKMARDLDAVVEATCFGPTALVGHSIGGMIILTYCRLFPDKLGPRVNALVLAQSTYTNPVKTTRYAGLMEALQKPVLEPMLHLMIWLAPLVRVLNWMSYINGSAHRSTERTSFTGRETRGQLDFLTSLSIAADPATLAHGFLAMFRYDATMVLSTIPVPALVVTASEDSMCTPEASQHMARAIPQARLVNLADGRHCAVFEFHQEFHAAITEFLATPAAMPSRMAERQPAGG